MNLFVLKKKNSQIKFKNVLRYTNTRVYGNLISCVFINLYVFVSFKLNYM